MKAVLFVGVPGAGKTTFYIHRFFRTHVRINLDMLRTRRREAILFEACLTAEQPLVIDNTNPTAADRARYIGPAQLRRFRVDVYWFDTPLEDCRIRNSGRPPEQRVPDRAVLALYRKLQQPEWNEGFDRLYFVRVGLDDQFRVEEQRRPA